MSQPATAAATSPVERRLASVAQPPDERAASPGPWVDLVWDPNDKGSVQYG